MAGFIVFYQTSQARSRTNKASDLFYEILLLCDRRWDGYEKAPHHVPSGGFFFQQLGAIMLDHLVIRPLASASSYQKKKTKNPLPTAQH